MASSGNLAHEHERKSALHLAPPTTKSPSIGDYGDSIRVNTFGAAHETSIPWESFERRSPRLSRLRRVLRRSADAAKAARPCRFKYDYDEMVIGNYSESATTTAVMLVPPIGVGIGRWYYGRLLSSLRGEYGDLGHRLSFLSPDLLGSATASGPTNEEGDALARIPLLNITDWSDQITALMAEYERRSEGDGHAISRWCIVANGGCAPIALKAASESLGRNSPVRAAVTNVVISSPPRLPFFLESTDPDKVRRSYRTLSGVAGRVFWWYSLRRGGRFIRKFSERNLVGDPASLGEEWTPNCLGAAGLHGGRSRYSTFAFLAGALQDGCTASLNALKGTGVGIDFIRGADKRRNKAKSWFWTRKVRKGTGDQGSSNSPKVLPQDTIQRYVERNGNGGREMFIGGRISLAWEDPDGYAKALMQLIS